VAVSWQGGQAEPWTMLAPPLVNGDFEEVKDGRLVYWGLPPCEEDPGQGKYCLKVNRELTVYGFAHLLTPLKPNCRYRFSAMMKNAVAGGVAAHVVEYVDERNFVRSAELACTVQGQWQRQTVEFTTHSDPRSTAIYLYNFNRDTDAWFDGIELTEVR